MTEFSPVSGAQLFKNAMVATIQAVVDSSVLVTYGHPGLELVDDMIGVLKVTAQQSTATMGTNRSREEILTVDVLISCYRGGDQSMEKVCGDRAYALLGLIENQIRYVDPTLGGVVRDCFLTAHDSDGSTDPALLAKGRVIEVTATFTARHRVTNHL